MDHNQIKEESRRALINYWTARIGQDFGYDILGR